MSNEQWTDLGPVDDFPEGTQHCLTTRQRPIVLFHIDGQFYAIANVCPHAGLPLGEGERRGLVITCPFHGYMYNIRKGTNIDWPHDEPPVRTYPTRVVDGQVQVKIEEKTQP